MRSVGTWVVVALDVGGNIIERKEREAFGGGQNTLFTFPCENAICYSFTKNVQRTRLKRKRKKGVKIKQNKRWKQRVRK